jgi:hypothetical protein
LPKFGNEEPLPLEVDIEMVDTSVDGPEWDFCLQDQQLAGGLCESPS